MGLFKSMFKNGSNENEEFVSNVKKNEEDFEKEREEIENKKYHLYVLYTEHSNEYKEDHAWFLTDEAEENFEHIEDIHYRIAFVKAYLRSLKMWQSKDISNIRTNEIEYKIALILIGGMYKSGIEPFTSLKNVLDINVNPIVKTFLYNDLALLSTNDIIDKLLCALHNKQTNFLFKDLTQLKGDDSPYNMAIYTLEREIIWFMSIDLDRNKYSGLFPYVDDERLDDLIHNPFDDHKDDDEYDGSNDSIYDDAYDYVVYKQKASAIMLMRKYGIAYSRAARVIEALEKEGAIGPANGTDYREVLIEYKREND